MWQHIAVVLVAVGWSLARIGHALADILRALNGNPRPGANREAGKPHRPRRRG
ncbi:hypothetical protein [Alicyclobacillus acidocaldarius]|uniref:hypothetical protein n=1 Tax=Alicyclobacillus acidocaldarius TaxID=405212 RepID=UPI0018728326|nr:hypothetical protein [Alicyclobacillus acidocaldarius]